MPGYVPIAEVSIQTDCFYQRQTIFVMENITNLLLNYLIRNTVMSR